MKLNADNHEVDAVRRQLLTGIIPLFVTLQGCKSSSHENNPLLKHLVSPVGTIPTPRKANMSGTLDSDQRSIFERYADFISSQFDFDLSNETTGFSINEFLELKSGQHPSYLFEYHDFLNSVNLLAAELGSEKDAFQFLFFHEIRLEEDKISRLAHHRVFVLWELANILVLSGGFKTWGIKNYTGYMGGVFSDPSNPPYRPFP